MSKLWLPSLLLLLLPTQNSCESVVKVNKCCHAGQILTRARDRCIPKSNQGPLKSQALHFPQNNNSFGLLPIWPNISGLKIRTNVRKVAMPKCGRTEAHPIGSKAWLTLEGGMVTEKYEKEFPHGDFCLERDIDQDLVAVMCDPCQEKVCLKLCCPHGKILKPNYEDGTDDKPSGHCISDSPQWSPKFWDLEDQVEVKLERHSQYVLQVDNTEDGAFHCPEKHNAFVDAISFDDFKLNQQGIGRGTYFGTNTTMTFNNSQFCVTFAHLIDYDDIDYDGFDYEEEEIPTEEIPIVERVAYLVCTPEEDGIEEDKCISSVVSSVSIYISCFFLFLAIIIHILLPKLHNHLIGKMVIGLLINMLICYLSIAYLHTQKKDNFDAILGTPRCTFLGFLIQYSYLAFFFWLNSMAAYIFLKTTNIVHFDDAKQIIIFFIYSQVFPFLISFATGLVDITETDRYGRRRIPSYVKPNMGQYSCFLGSEETLPFFRTPEFVYFHSFMLFITILNVIYFSVTLVLIVTSSRYLSEEALLNKHNLRLVMTLFFLMGMPWVSEFIVGFSKGKISCQVQILLDEINLFAGPLIFVFLVVKKDILVNLLNIVLCRQIPKKTKENIAMNTFDIYIY